MLPAISIIFKMAKGRIALSAPLDSTNVLVRPTLDWNTNKSDTIFTAELII